MLMKEWFKCFERESYYLWTSFMKGIIFILVLASMIFHPRHVSAMETKQLSPSSPLFQNSQNEHTFVSDNSESSDSYFDDDLSDKDDDDINYSVRKKFSFGSTTFDVTALFTLTRILYDSRTLDFCSANLFYLPPSHFIALKVFRL